MTTQYDLEAAGHSSITRPHLVYIGDVPVETGFGGSQLLHRLLEEYPRDRLAVVETDIYPRDPDRRLTGTDYLTVHLPLRRLLYSRAQQWYGNYLLLTARRRARLLARVLRGRRPDSVVTVAHGHGWLIAAEAARFLDLPLHLIIHDPWEDMVAATPAMARRAERMFAAVYREAASRLCVSPAMAEHYQRLYGAPATVLYPSWERAARRPDEQPAAGASDRPPTFGYAGSTANPAYARMLGAMVGVMANIGGKLIVYTDPSPELLDRVAPYSTVVEIRAPIPSADLVRILPSQCDALFLPMSFDDDHQRWMALLFPSKLADYTATGLPVLIWGPAYSSAVRWAREHEGTALVVEGPGTDLLQCAAQRLAGDAELRARLGKAAHEAGQQCFDYDVVAGVFATAVTGGTV